jgi:hypothetical protein
MGKRWKTIVGFAMLGFAITAGFYILGVYKDYTKPFGLLDAALSLANIILCPPVLLFAWCIDCGSACPAVQSGRICVPRVFSTNVPSRLKEPTPCSRLVGFEVMRRRIEPHPPTGMRPRVAPAYWDPDVRLSD